MTGPRIGSLCSGYGGLDMGVQAVYGGSVAWHVEYDRDPSKIPQQAALALRTLLRVAEAAA